MITIRKKKFFTVQDIAEEIPLSVLSVLAYIKKGKILTIRIGRRYYISETNLDKFLGD